MKTKITIAVATAAFLMATTGLSANGLGQGQVVYVSGSSSTNSDLSSSLSSSSTIVQNEDIIDPTKVSKRLFTNNEIEELMLSSRDGAEKLRETIKQMVYAKRNPIKGDVQTYDIGAEKDIRDYVADIVNYLSEDEALLSERDTKALAALKKLNEDLQTQLSDMQKTIPLGDTGFELPQDTEISVIGTSNLQVHELVVGGKVIGHYRTGCYGALKEDILINNSSVNYCVASLYVNGAPRVSDTQRHREERTDMYFVGISDAYVAGKDSTVKIRWQSHPKSSVVGAIKYYNMENIPGVVDTLMYENTVTTSSGKKYPGKRAIVEK